MAAVRVNEQTTLLLDRDPAIHADSLRAQTQAAFVVEPVTELEKLTDADVERALDNCMMAICNARSYDEALPHSLEMRRLHPLRSRKVVKYQEERRGLRK